MKNLIILPLLLLIIASCTDEHELEKSVFVNDPNFTDLPVYSEWGYNTFGAYYDRQPFISNNDEVPAKVIVSNEATSFILSGQKGASNYYYESNNTMSLTIDIVGLSPANYNELILLNDTTFDLHAPTVKVTLTMDGTEKAVKVIEGKINFKRAQNLFVDTESVETILSGYFEFRALVNDIPVTLSNGRFDVGIGKDNFYMYYLQ